MGFLFIFFPAIVVVLLPDDEFFFKKKSKPVVNAHDLYDTTIETESFLRFF